MQEPKVLSWLFEDVSTQVGLGPDGIGSDVKGDTLTVDHDVLMEMLA